jgi:DNA processing protein
VAVTERDGWAVLASVSGVGPVALARLLDRFGSARAALAAASGPRAVDALIEAGLARQDDGSTRRIIGPALATAIVEAAQRTDAILGRIRSLGLAIVTVEEAVYPHRLGAIELPPHVLFVRGDIAALDPGRAVAVVGTRRPTFGGRRITTRIAAALAATGATVVSGLAVGVDGEAHLAAVEAGGSTVAVIGSGHANLFPRAHERLAERIVESGGAVISELAPDDAPTKGTFPRRNRVVSGLSDATVVVEAPARSGALITASWALEQGRECFLVPGSIDAAASQGCLAFLREYAGAARIVSGIPQLLDDLGLVDHDAAGRIEAAPRAEAALLEIGGTAARIGRELVAGRSTVDELVAVTGEPVATVLAALTLLEGRGMAAASYGRYRPSGPLAALPPGVAPGR